MGVAGRGQHRVLRVGDIEPQGAQVVDLGLVSVPLGQEQVPGRGAEQGTCENVPGSRALGKRPLLEDGSEHRSARDSERQVQLCRRKHTNTHKHT